LTDATPDKVSFGDLLPVPGYRGFGESTITGGRGGETYKVTNLNDSGPGSFREAVTTGAGPRNVLIAVGGRVNLQSEIFMGRGDLTIFGQTAAGRGFELFLAGGQTSPTRNVIRMLHSNIIQQHYGIVADGTNDPVNWHGQPSPVNRQAFINMSVTGGLDEITQAWREFQDYIIACCIFSEPQTLNNSRKGPLFDTNNVLTSGRMSVYRNLFSHCIGRMPFFAETQDTDHYNNGHHNGGNWRSQYRVENAQRQRGNHESNWYQHGANTPAVPIGKDISLLANGAGSGHELFIADNWNATLGIYDEVNNPFFNTPPANRYAYPRVPTVWAGNQVKANLPAAVGPRNIAAGSILWTPDQRRVGEFVNVTGQWANTINAPTRPTELSNPLLDFSEPDCVPKAYKDRCGFAHGTDLSSQIGIDGYDELERWVYFGMPQS
jgi:hypothetical protein